MTVRIDRHGVACFAAAACLPFVASPAAAVCTNTAIQLLANGGSTCVVPTLAYTISTTGAPNAAVHVYQGATMTFAGSASITTSGARHGLAIGYQGVTPPSSATIPGNLFVSANGVNIRALLNYGTLYVGGNLTAQRLGTTAGGAAVETVAGSTTTIDGAGANSISSVAVQGFRSFGTSTFRGDTTITTAGASNATALSSGGQATFLGGLSIQTVGSSSDASAGSAGATSSGIFSDVGGVVTSAGPTSIRTSGSASPGVAMLGGVVALGGASYTPTAGATIAALGPTATITTSGANAGALRMRPAAGPIFLTMDAGASLGTTGAGAHGAFLQTVGANDISAALAGSISAPGAGADALRVTAATGASRIDVNGGALTGGSGAGAAIHVVGGQSATINVATGASVDGSAGAAGVLSDAPAITLSSAGTIRGGILTSLGADAVSLQNGSLTTGPVSLGAGSDALTIAAGADIAGVTLFDGGDDVSTADGMIDRLTFTGARAIAGGLLRNWEEIVVDGGRLSFPDGAVTTSSEPGRGLIALNGGVIDASGGLAVTGAVGLRAGTLLAASPTGTGLVTISGQLTNAAGSTVDMSGATPAPGDRLVVGQYVGGGRLIMDVAPETDASVTDRLVVNGPVSGVTSLLINAAPSLGAQTTGDGIQLIRVFGASPAGSFVQSGRIAAGAYEYTLYNGGVGANASDGSWYLRSVYTDPTPAAPAPAAAPALPDYRGEVPLYLSLPSLASRFGLSTLGSFRDRAPGDEAAPASDPCQAAEMSRTRQRTQCVTLRDRKEAQRLQNDLVARNIAWARLYGAGGEQRPGGGSAAGRLARFESLGPSYAFGVAGFQAGSDLYRGSLGSARHTFGAMFGVGRIQADVQRVYGGRAGDVRLDGFSFGGYWTARFPNGVYVDAVAQATRLSGQTSSLGAVDASTRGWSAIASLETGVTVDLGGGCTIGPQPQAIFQRITFDRLTDMFGVTSFRASDSLIGRAGARVSRMWRFDDGRGVEVSLRANVWKASEARSRVTFANAAGLLPLSLPSSLGGSWGELSLDASARLTRAALVFGSVTYVSSFDRPRSFSVGGRAGLRLAW